MEEAQPILSAYLWHWVCLRSECHWPGKRTGLHLPKQPGSGWGSVSSHVCWCDSVAWTWAESHLWSRHPRYRRGWESPQRSSYHTQTPPHPLNPSPPADGSLDHKHTALGIQELITETTLKFPTLCEKRTYLQQLLFLQEYCLPCLLLFSQCDWGILFALYHSYHPPATTTIWWKNIPVIAWLRI